jgi:hypothetical protein
MIIRTSDAIKTAQLQAVIDALDAATFPGRIDLYTGPMPNAPGGDITSQKLIGSCALSLPSGTVSDTVLTFEAISEDLLVDETGDIEWARFSDGNGNFVMDGDCGPDGSGALIEFNRIDAVENGAIRIVGGQLTMGA